MQPQSRYKLGGQLLAAGAGLALLLKAYLLIIPNTSPLSMAYRVVGSIVGYWFALLVMPPTIEGTNLEFSWSSLVWVPWAAVFLAFLLWVGVKVIRGRYKSSSIPLSILGLFGAWFIVGLLYEKITNGFDFDLDLKWLLPFVLSDFAIIAMIAGIGLILLNYKEVMAGTLDEVSLSSEMKLSDILFSFQGRINRAKFWLYQVLILNLIFIACIAIGASTGNRDGITAGYAIGALLILWPSLALGVKRCHDRNRSGAFVLVSIIPIVSLWYAVEVLFLRGTQGDNQYGPDPLIRQIRDENEGQTLHST